MAKKRKNKEPLPEGMSRRQAKLAARAAERAALTPEARPYEGLAMEADLVALQEFVPSAVAELKVEGLDEPVNLCTVLPGAVAALVRAEAHGAGRYVALQVQHRTHNPGKDLAFALNWVKDAAPGATLTSTASDGSQPKITDLIAADQTLSPVEHQDFNWWLPENADINAQIDQGLKRANDSIVPSHHVEADVNGVCWWVDAGDKAHIRWIRTDDEDKLLTALARIAAKGELNLGEDTKFAGVFRTHGIIVPVFDLDRTTPWDSYGEKLAALDKVITEEIGNDAQLTADERKQLDNIKSRQVTIR
ncbi:DUF5926 family protein [Corynebacterium mendelii]|uniref:Preprotein translocase subunit SecA n=1 Tax=Corynebacterium mendelii TaxID=2765362 RepID=A0A939E4M9_9CORY|nr:DUF5926 family protein [Corynebacterium mendelii]MBN9645317.1 preprotein translocase subunit SecA [Corynebacterium mendelii]